MNLQPVTGTPFYAQCLRCLTWGMAGDGHKFHADLDGEPWHAYYCGKCVQKLTTVFCHNSKHYTPCPLSCPACEDECEPKYFIPLTAGSLDEL